MLRPHSRPVVGTLVVAALASCNTSVDPSASPDAQAVSAACLEAVDHSDLDWIQANVLNGGCALANACHRGAALSAGGLNLEAGMTETELVNMPSQIAAELGESYDLVEPGDPDNSYLMIILGHKPGPIEPTLGTMPLNSPLLCVEKRDAIERWIESLQP